MFKIVHLSHPPFSCKTVPNLISLICEFVYDFNEYQNFGMLRQRKNANPSDYIVFQLDQTISLTCHDYYIPFKKEANFSFNSK